MKKKITKFMIILITSATILPLTACTFNFYINRVTTSIAKSFADQTSALIKSMVMSKELDADTSSTNDDIMGQIKNSSINNLTNNTTLNNWGDLQSRWGENGNIDVKGFNPDQFFKASGTGQLTKSINSKKNINNIFSNLSYIRTIAIMSNQELVNIVKGKGLEPITNFLKSLQGDENDKPAGLQLVINLINNFNEDFLKPLTNIFNNLINGSWSDSQTKTPDNLQQLTTFMTNWKDNNGQPYSAWNDGTTWKINPSFIATGHSVADWEAKEDYDLYRGGTLINYLFWKIGKDHNINKNPRYLGEIIQDHLDGTNFDDQAFLVDLQQYLPFLLTNPLYILTIVEAIIPIIKKWILDMPDITAGVKYLTIGNGYPSNPTTGSYNLLNIANTIKSLITDPTKLKEILTILFGGTTASNRGFDTFLYDIKIKTKVPILGEITTSVGAAFGTAIIPLSPDVLINPIIDIVNNDSVKNTIDDVINLLTQISQEYPGNEGINIELEKLSSFLFDNTTGLLVILNNDTIGVLQNIIKQSDVTTTDIEELYKALGGHVNKEDPDFPTFTSGSILDILQSTMLEQDSELNKILNLVLGTTDEYRKLGIADIISANNNQWIKDNYNAYFDADNTTGINKKIANTYNITMNKNTNNNIETINLKYDFIYKINNKTYHFIVTTIDIENLNDFQGIRTFKFKNITLVT